MLTVQEKYFRYISIVLVLTFCLTMFNMSLIFEHGISDFLKMVDNFPYKDLLINSNYLLLLSLLFILYGRWGEELKKRRKSEEAMISLHRAAENMQIGVTITDHKRIIRYTNPAEAQMHGYSVKELIGKDARLLGPPGSRNPDPQALRSRFRRETLNIRKDGSTFPVQLMSDTVMTDRGDVLAVVTTCEDISERKQMELEKEKLIEKFEHMLGLISRSQKEWQETFDAITDVIFLSDLNFTIRRVNRAAEKMLGMPLNDILGKKCYELFHGSDTAPFSCAGCVAIETGKSVETDELQHKLNIFLNIRVIPRFNSDSELIGLIHVIRDMTDRKKLEDRLAHARKIEAIGQLAGGIAHDFNNILTAIKSSGKLLDMKADKESGLRTYISQILDMSETGADLVRGLLSFSGKQEFHPVPVDLNSFIRGSGPLFRNIVTEKIDFEFRLADHPLNVIADKTGLDRVLINLVANARDAMPSGGVISISTDEVEVEKNYRAHLLPGKYAVIGISDSGAGMDENISERVFDPFFTTKEVGKGTGLGLSLAYGIIRQHEGDIEVQSSPGSGTLMKVFVPLAAAGAGDFSGGGTRS